MKKRLLSLVTAIALVAGSFSWAPDVQAADINNIPAPTYSIQKTADGSDVFVTAYNVKDFGADATGASDCTEIFQKLLNKTGELGGGVVYVPSGRYKISGSLRIPKGVTLRGDWTKPVKGKSLTSGTVLMAYVGRGQGETDTPFVEMEPETGCMNLTVWYPEQNPNDIVKYSPTIRLGVNNYFGNEYSNVKNVTLVNSYIGVWYNRNNFGASPVINGVYGTPLKKGVEIDCIADVGRIENVHLSPEYWKGSGFANAPSDDSVRDYVYENATGIVMRRNDWSYTCYVDVEGYNIGYNTNFSYDGNRSTPNGHHYHFNLTNCKNGIVFDTSNYVGILFDDIKMYNCESGIVVKEGTSDVVQFSKAKLTCRKYAVNIAKTSSTKLLMNDCTIEQGVVNIDGGTLMSTGCAYNNKAPQIAIGSLGRVSLAGNSFKVAREIVNKSIYKSDLSNAAVELKSVPTFDDSKAEFKSHAPSGERITVVTSAPYNADVSRDHGGASDCTASIQNALNDTKNAGGGIVYLPAGHYRLNGNITIPSGVELRGANDVSTVPHGAGSILEVYGGRGDANGTAAIRIESNAGIRAVTINYPEQTYKVDGNGVFDPVYYPFTMQGMGENVYVINVGVRAATRVLDLSTYRCNNHYVDFLTGHVTKECVRVGGGSKGGVINNLMFNTLIYAAGQESKFGGFPNSPANVEGSVYDQQLNDLEFIVLGDCDGETLYNCFPYGAHIGVKLINQGGGGPQNLVSMGLGVDGSRKAIYFDSGLNGTMDFINNQIVSLNNDQPITRYIEAKSGSDFTANFYNTDCWGYPEKSIVLGDGCGTVNMYTANFQARGYNTALDVSDGSALNLYASSFNANGSTFSSGTGNIAMVATVADYSEGEAGSFKANVAGFGSSSEISGESPAAAVDRSGWRASASTHNEDAYKSLDGDLYSQWTTMDAQTNGQWYQVDLGQMTEFDTIVTTLGRTNDVPRGYVVKVSDDGTNWREVATGENNNIYSVGNQKARYVRIEQTMSEGHWWAVYEFYVLKSESYDPGEGEEIEPEAEYYSGNPIINPLTTNLFTADPSAHVWEKDGKLYVYASHDQFPSRGCDLMDKYHVFSTTNMVDWKDEGQILSSDDVSWGRPEGGFMWAPDAALRDGTYYFYFPHPTGSGDQWNSTWRIGIATSDKPASGFVCEDDGYIKTKDGDPYVTDIDPCVFKDDNGEYYLYTGGGSNCQVAKLAPDMKTLAEEPVKLSGLTDFHEAMWVFKKDGLYYAMYADNSDGENCMRYATAHSPYGPWTYKDIILDGTGCDTTHGSICEYKGHWYLFYHNCEVSGNGTLRNICVDEVFFNVDGTIEMVEQTKKGVAAVDVVDQASHQEGNANPDPSKFTIATNYDIRDAILEGGASQAPNDIQNLHLEGSSAQWNNVDGGKGGTAMVTLHYASADGATSLVSTTGDPTGGMEGDGYFARMVKTGGWDDHSGTTTFYVHLNPGKNNSIKFLGGMGGFNISGLTVAVSEEGDEVTTTVAPTTTFAATTTAGPTTTVLATTTTAHTDGEVDETLQAPFGLSYAGNDNLPYYFAWGALSGMDGFNVYVDGNYVATETGFATNIDASWFSAGDEHVVAVRSVKGGKVSKATAISYNKATGEVKDVVIPEETTNPTTKEPTTQPTTVVTTTVAPTTTFAATTTAEPTTTAAITTKTVTTTAPITTTVSTTTTSASTTVETTSVMSTTTAKSTTSAEATALKPTTMEMTCTVESTATMSTSGKPNLAKVKIKKIYKKKKSAKKIKIKVRKVKGAKGYYVAVYKTKKLAKKNKKPLLKKYYKKNKAIFKISSKKLKNKSKLFVRVRAYAKIDDEVFYGKWSKVVKVK